VLKIAERHGCLIVEDDVSADLVQGAHLTLASMDQLKNVIYVGSFSKTIGAGLRVGFVVADHDVVEGLLYQKLVSGMSTPTVTERLVSAVLSEGHYRKQTEQLRDRLGAAQEKTCRRLEASGFEVFCEPRSGMFLWARPTGVDADSSRLAELALQEKILLAPGHLFFAGRCGHRNDLSHFPQRSGLVVAALCSEVDACADAGVELAATLGAGEALLEWVDR
jgi:DNA-binding transcriptional MocR family regulator